MIKYSFLLILLLLAGCSSTRKQQAALQQSDGAKVVTQLLFINVLLKKEADSTVVASLVNYKWKEGSLRQAEDEQITSGEVLQIDLLSADQKILKEVVRPNPLFRSVEYFGEGGEIGRQDVAVDEAYLSLRVEAPVIVKYIRIVSETGGYSYLLEL